MTHPSGFFMTRDISSFSRTYRRLRGFALGVTLLLAMSCGGPPTGSVILVVVDTLRADHLGLYGYDRPTSPTLDAWAAEGRVFEHAFAPAPWTLPSFGSLYTGRWPLVQQAGRADVFNRSGQTGFLGPIADLPILAETLRAVGFRTLAVVNNGFLSPTFGMARGFDIYDFEPGTSDGVHRSATVVVQRALELVDDVNGQPFFLVVHLLEPHLFYDAPPPFRNSFSASIRSDFTLPIADLVGLRNGSRDIAPQDRAFVTAAYDEEIAYVDEQLGVLRDGLAARGLLETSMVVLTSDHGEELFDHGGFEHGHAMWQELLHVPLVVWAPGVEPGRETAPVSLVDVAPTVLDSLGIAPPTPFDGISLWPNLTAVEPLPQRPLFAEGVLYGAPQTAVVNWPQKMIIDHAKGERDVYDLEEDPRERDSLASESRDLVAAFCRHLQTGEESDRAPVTPSQEVTDQLRSLGYLGGGSAATTSFMEYRQYPCYSDVGWGSFVHVRWADSVDAALRTTLEQSLGLVRAEHLVETTWRYRLPDPSPDRLHAIVNHAMVEDTHGFDRATLELDRWHER